MIPINFIIGAVIIGIFMLIFLKSGKKKNKIPAQDILSGNHNVSLDEYIKEHKKFN